MESIFMGWNEDQSRTKAEAFNALPAYCLPSGNVVADWKQGRDDITFSVLVDFFAVMAGFFSVLAVLNLQYDITSSVMAVLNLQYDVTSSVIPDLIRDLQPRSTEQEMADQVRNDSKGGRDSRKLQYDITFSVIPDLIRDLPLRSTKQEIADQVRNDSKGVRESRKLARSSVLVSGTPGSLSGARFSFPELPEACPELGSRFRNFRKPARSSVLVSGTSGSLSGARFSFPELPEARPTRSFHFRKLRKHI